MTFQELYSSPWILPALPCAALPIVLVLAARRKGFFRAWGLLFAALIVVDAYLNGALTPVRSAGWATFLGITFVIVGDLRYFLAVEHTKANRFVVPAAFGLAFVVPVLSQIARAAFPAVAAELRVTYLTYEVLFLGVLAAYYFLRVRSLDGAARAFATKLTLFEAVQYGLWASIDVLLLVTKRDAGYLLRIVPDVMYYVAFVPFVLRLAAKREDAK
ncbi:MAG TPA: hypothetical protein VF316_20635 [Polyangiaceae bacterium]